MKETSTRQMVVELKTNNMDFEWFPTTAEIIETIKKDYDENYYEDYPSVLDCGAGDGRVLKALTKGDKYAIEKSKPLLNALDKDIFVVGTTFEHQTLIDKSVSIIFSNPPYSEYEMWATKIIKEANAQVIYLVIPSRWKDSLLIQEAVELREGKTEVIGSFDFLNAERQARAHVDIIRVAITYNGHRHHSLRTDPFRVWFESFFKIDIAKEEPSKYDLDQRAKAHVNDRLSNELIKGNNIVSALEELYRRDLDKLINTYQSLSDVDSDILRELDVNLESVRGALKQKIEGLKDRYWQELFDNLNTVTDKLTASSRKQLLDTLTAHTHVDFTSSNSHAVICWVIKNANDFYSTQLIRIVERMTEKANVINYVSNQRTFGRDEWRYNKHPDNLERYKLDYRIVLERIGGISTSSYTFECVNGLTPNAAGFIDDLCTIATNLGYNTYNLERARSYSWESNQQKEFQFRDIHTSELKTLFKVRAFKNGNLHIFFNPKFIMRLSVEFGRLKGWLKSAQEAASEMDISEEDARAGFGSNIQLTNQNVLALEFKEVA